MLWKAMKLTALTVGGASLVGGVIFGSDLASYVRSACHSVSSAVKDEIPVSFQIERARTLLGDTGPEMQRNVRLMAEEEVDIANLRDDITRTKQSLQDEKVRLSKLRDDLNSPQASFTFGDFVYTRQELVDELSRRFENYQQAVGAEMQKEQLLIDREKALSAASQALDLARAQRSTLDSEIDGLEGRYRLAQATATGSGTQIDSSKLAQAEQVVGDVRHELDVSDRVLAQEAKFTHSMPLDTVDEKDLLRQVDTQLSASPQNSAAASNALSDATVPPAAQ